MENKVTKPQAVITVATLNGFYVFYMLEVTKPQAVITVATCKICERT